MKLKQYLTFMPILFILSLFTFLQTQTISAQEQAETSKAQQALEAVWQQAQTSGAYEFRTLINQTIYPAPKVSNAGRPPQKERVGIEGSINTYAESFNMTFWRNATFDPAQGIEMKVENGRSYARTSHSEWEEVGSITDSFAPAGDPLNFLAGVSHVQQGEDHTFTLANIEETFTTYHFDLDSSQLAAHLRSLIQQQLHQSGQLPASIMLGELDHYRQMIGTGELWVNAQGLPARLSLDLDMGTTDEGEKITAVITTEFSNFDMTLLETTLLANPQTWLAAKLPTTAVQQQAGINLTLSLTLITLLLLFAIYWQKKWMYKLIATIITLSLIFSPFLNGEITHAYYDHVRAEEKQHEANQAKAEMVKNGREALKNEWDPHQSPRQANSKLVNDEGALATETPSEATQLTLASNDASASEDSDGDGLDDAAEADWESCAYPLNSTEYNNSEACEGVADPSDSDGDGLSDAVEVYELYTYPDLADSDGDTITDTLEVGGFFYNGQQWYLDPNEADTNSDGLNDGLECEVWYPGSDEFDETAVCPDTDNDGTPDLFDDDNDDDGVLDIDDISPDSKGTAVYDGDNPLQVTIDGLQTEKPILIDLQFRPTEEDHLTYSGLILDWPTGDYEGQIQRTLTTTFATTDDADAYSTDDDASYGDIKIFPMLEIYIPYQDGHYGNLPVNSSYAGISRTLDLTISQWLDTTELDPYSITIVDADETSGDLAAYVPLVATISNTGDGAVAFAAQMVYYPSQGSNGIVDWGAGHQYRVTWVVQMITDNCIDGLDEDEDGDPDNEDGTQCEREDDLNIIHTYEEAWQLTGYAVSEQHSYDAALLYENPIEDEDLEYDDLLWLFGWNLSNTFVAGLDCDTIVDNNCQGDGERDVTLDNLSSKLDEWATDDGGTNQNYVEIVNKSYLHSGYMSVVALTDTVDILDTVFMSYTDQTYPSLLILDETVSRDINLDSLTTVTESVTLDLSELVTTTMAGLVLATYQYDSDDGAWTAVDDEEYLDHLTALLEEVEYFQASDDSEESIDEAEGKLIWAQSYYTALATGMSGYVETAGLAFYTPADVIEEAQEELIGQVVSTTRGRLAQQLAGKTANVLIARLLGNSTASTDKIWRSIKSFYRVQVSGKYVHQMGTHRGYTIKNSISNNKLLYKLTQTWNVKIIKASGAILLAGALVYASSFVFGGTTSDVLATIGQALIIVSTITLIALELVVVMAKYVSINKFVSSNAYATKTVRKSAKLKVAKSYAVRGLFSIVLSGVVIWGMFAYQVEQLGVGPNSVTYNLLAAYAVALSIIEVLLAIISVFFPVGTVLVLLFTIVDLFLIFLSFFFDDVKSLTDIIAEALADVLYDVNTMIDNFDDDDRLAFDVHYELLDPALGYVVGNGLLYTTTVTNTIMAKESFSNQTRNTFVYRLQLDETEQHDGLSLRQMEDEWLRVPDIYSTSNGDYDGAQVSNTLVITHQFETIGTGINQEIPTFYLTEAYAIAIQGCWQFFGIDTSCQWEAFKGSNHFDIDYLTFDILPETLKEFVSLTWSGSDLLANNNELNKSAQSSSDDNWLFGNQIDQDGDNLLNTIYGGTDTDDTNADIDGDGLTDYYEITNGTDPEDADSDNDGLNDAEETFVYFTDPNNPDTDGDTLSDYLELVQGWLVSYVDMDDNLNYTRVWSDPFSTDYDGDDLSDLIEFTFGFNPHVTSDASAIENTVQFDNIAVTETDTPLLLLKMEEDEDVATFLDSSGERNNATCNWTADACPVAGVDGIYGAALEFDGVNDELVISHTDSLDFGTGSFTAAAWVKTDSFADWQNIISKKSGMGTNVGWTLRLNQNGSASIFLADGSQTWHATSNSDLVTDQWYHVAGVVDSEQDKVHFYVDGELITTLADYAGNISNTDAVVIGSWAEDSNPDFFDGVIDEALLFTRALTTTEIVDVMNGRYNTNDLLVRAGAELNYQATVTNTNSTQAVSGFLIGQTQVISPQLPTPVTLYNFDQEDRTAYFENKNGEENAAYCFVETCPTTGVQGSDGSAIEFDGDDDYVVVPTLLQDKASIFEISFDIYLNSLPESGERMYILDTTEETTGSLDIYINDSGYLLFDVQNDNDSGDRPSINMNSYVGAWRTISVDTAAGNYGSWDPDVTTLGNGRLGNNLDSTSGLDGRIDEFSVLPQSTDTALTYEFDKVADYDGTVFLDGQNETDHGTCSGTACPTLILDNDDNRYIEFDGVDDTFTLESSSSMEEFTLSWDMYIDAYPGSTVSIFESNTIDISLNSSGQISVDRTDGNNNSSSNSVPLNQWNTIQVKYQVIEYGTGTACYLKYTLTVDGTNDSDTNYGGSTPCANFSISVGNGTFGSTDGSSNFYTGAMDNIDFAIATYDFEVTTSNITYLDRVDDRATSNCAEPLLAPTR